MLSTEWPGIGFIIYGIIDWKSVSGYKSIIIYIIHYMRQTRQQTNWRLHLHMHCDTDYTAARSQVTTVLKGLSLAL